MYSLLLIDALIVASIAGPLDVLNVRSPIPASLLPSGTLLPTLPSGVPDPKIPIPSGTTTTTTTTTTPNATPQGTPGSPLNPAWADVSCSYGSLPSIHNNPWLQWNDSGAEAAWNAVVVAWKQAVKLVIDGRIAQTTWEARRSPRPPFNEVALLVIDSLSSVYETYADLLFTFFPGTPAKEGFPNFVADYFHAAPNINCQELGEQYCGE